MPSNLPLISIGITCFNSSKTLKRAIESALNQNWEKKEIIIVDDFSSDDSLQIIEFYIDKYPFIKLIKHNQNKGYPAALNSIVKNAKGEYISIFDSDDSSELDRLRKQFLRLSDFQKEFHHMVFPIFATNQRELVQYIYLLLQDYFYKSSYFLR